MTLLLLLSGCPGPTEPSTEACTTCDGECVEEAVPEGGSAHVDGDVAYEEYPPTSGDHWDCWAAWGVHSDTVPAERWVHNLQHGGVVFLYAANAPMSDVQAMSELVAGLPEGRALMTVADAAMDAPFAALSWEHRLLLGCVDTEALQAFFDEHVANGPEDTTSPPAEGCDA